MMYRDFETKHVNIELLTKKYQLNILNIIFIFILDALL